MGLFEGRSLPVFFGSLLRFRYCICINLANNSAKAGSPCRSSLGVAHHIPALWKMCEERGLHERFTLLSPPRSQLSQRPGPAFATDKFCPVTVHMIQPDGIPTPNLLDNQNLLPFCCCTRCSQYVACPIGILQSCPTGKPLTAFLVSFSQCG